MKKKLIKTLTLPLLLSSLTSFAATIHFDLHSPVTLVNGPGHAWSSVPTTFSIPLGSDNRPKDSTYAMLNGGVIDSVVTKSDPQDEVVVNFGQGHAKPVNYTLTVSDGSFSKTIACHSGSSCSISGIKPYDSGLTIKLTN